MSILNDPKSNTHYVFLEILGRGSYGKCFKVVEQRTKKQYACKIFKDDQNGLEMAIHSKLHHKNIVSLFNEIIAKDCTYLIMELCSLGTLATLLNGRKTLTDPEVSYIVKEISHGVQYLHSNLVIHRDLKLENILITNLFTIKICDFGLSVKVKDFKERRTSLCGTHDFMAPELWFDPATYSFSVDIWAIGCIIYTLLNEKHPFKGRTDKETQRNITNVIVCQTKCITSLCWNLLEKIFCKEELERPTAFTLLDHPYFSQFSLSEMDISVFYMAANTDSMKKKPFRDRTNLVKKEAVAKSCTQSTWGKENVLSRKPRTMAIKLRSRIKIEAIEENLETLLQNKGASIACKLLPLLLDSLKLRDMLTQDVLLKTKKPVVSIRRWVAGLTTFGYETSDGSFAVVFNNSFAFYKPLLGESQFFRCYKDAPLPPEDQIQNMMISVDFVKKTLDDLRATEPIFPTTSPVIVLAHKFLEIKTPDDPSAIFLLSNGSCQVNSGNHEKLIVNAYDDWVVLWKYEEYYAGRLSELLRLGTPISLRKKLQYICYFLTVLLGRNKPATCK